MTKLHDGDQLLKEVVEFCNELFADANSEGDSRQLMGIVYLYSNNPNQAVKQFSEVMKYAPQSTKLYYLRSKAFYDLGDFDKAYQDYVRALKNRTPLDETYIAENPESEIINYRVRDEEQKADMNNVTTREVLDTLLAYMTKYRDPRLIAFIEYQLSKT